MLRLSFAHKLAFTMTTMVLLAAFVIGYPMVHRQFSMMEEQFETIGYSMSQQAANSAVEPIFVSDVFAIDRLVKSFSDNTQVLSVVLVNRDLEIFGTPAPRLEQNILTDSQYFQSSGVINADNEISWFHVPVRFEGVTGGSLWLGLDKSPLLSNQRWVIYSALAAIVFLVTAIIWLAVRLSRNLSKPINELVLATQAIDSGNYSYRIRQSHSGEFANAKVAFNNMACNLEEKLRLEKNISRFVSSPVAHYYMSKNESELTLQGERVEASILFVDLVNYTGFSEQHAPEKVADILNFYFSEFAEACHQFEGNVDKYIGDCAMLVFGCPNSDTFHREHALECAWYIRNRIRSLNEQRQVEQQPWLDIRIGLAGGTVLAGLLGSQERLNYSVIGDAANLAARLCAKAPHGEILIDRNFLMAIRNRDRVRTHDTQRLDVKGFSQPVDTLVVEDLIAESQGVLN